MKFDNLMIMLICFDTALMRVRYIWIYSWEKVSLACPGGSKHVELYRSLILNTYESVMNLLIYNLAKKVNK